MRGRYSHPEGHRIALGQLWRVLFLVAACADWNMAISREPESPPARAFAGSPFGIGELELSNVDVPKDRPVWLFERNQRTLYPAVTRKDDGLVLRFLFTGTQPLHLTVVADRSLSATVQTLNSPKNADKHRALLNSWWGSYRQQFDSNRQVAPSSLETYLTGMLSRRLDLPAPPAPTRWASAGGMIGFDNSWTDFVEMVVGTASVKAAMQRETLLQGADADEIADRPLPEATAPPSVELPESFTGAEVEELAHHVPEECFYVRCRSIRDYDWLRTALGTLTMFAHGYTEAHAVDARIHDKLERQLAIRNSQELRNSGDKLVRHLAVIGTDPFVREGAAIGIVFEASDPDAFAQWIDREYRNARKQNPAVTWETISLAGSDVARLSTHDNRVRSFHVADGKFHLVTNSEYIARRFIEAGRGEKSLGKLKEFQFARATKFALDRDDPLFVYLSDPLFRFFVSPHYRVEMTRRAKADAELELIELARSAAVAEGVTGKSVADLVTAELLPASILRRPDHSRPVLEAGVIRDSLRGARGCFLPVPDVPIKTITRAEEQGYQKFANLYQAAWRQTDPVAIAVSQAKDDREGVTRIVFDFAITPFARRHYGWLAAWLPKPHKEYITVPEGNVFTAQTLSPPMWKRADDWPTGHLFAGLRDLNLPVKLDNGEVQAPKMRGPQELPWYFGQAGAPGFFELLFGGRDWDEIDPDEDGYFQFKNWFGRWHRVWDDVWMAGAQQKEVLTAVTPQLKTITGAREAHIRLHVADLSTSQVLPFAEAQAYVFSRRASARTAEYLHHLAQQLQLDVAESPKAAQRILNGELTCALGGEFQLADGPGGVSEWISTRWPDRSRFADTAVPEGFRNPFLDGLRGAEVELTLSLPDQTLTSHVELAVPQAAAPDAD